MTVFNIEINLQTTRHQLDSLLNEAQTTQTPFWLVLLGAWLATLIMTPIAIWTIGDSSIPTIISLGVLAKASLAVVALRYRWGWRKIARVMLTVAVVTWFAEYIGSQTGFPFGTYFYTERLQPQIGHVPLVIPLAWLMLLPSAWAVAHLLLKRTPYAENRLAFAALAGVTFTAWDLYLDPQMVAKELWIWEYGGAYFGIPLINYFGWWLVSSTLSFIIFSREQKLELATRPLLIVYTLTWLFQAVGLGIIWGQPGPALVGFAAMGLLTLLAWRQELETWTSSSGRWAHS